MDITSFLAGTGITTVLLIGVAKLFLKSAVEQVMKRSAIKYESELHAKVQSELTQFNSALSIFAGKELSQFNNALALFAKRQEIQFTKLQEKRGDIIATLYQKLNEIHRLLARLLDRHKWHNGKDADKSVIVDKWSEEIKPVFDKLGEVYLFYGDNRFYFSRTLTKMLNTLISNIGYAAEIRISGVAAPEEARKEFAVMLIEIKQALDLVETEFKKLLGVDEDESKEATSLSQQPL